MAMQDLNAEVWHVQIILQQCVGPSPPFPCCSGLADLREQLPFIVTWWHVRLTAWCVCVCMYKLHVCKPQPVSVTTSADMNIFM